MNYNRLCLLMFFSLFFFLSCQTSKKVLYFQDVALEKNDTIVMPPSITIQPMDMLSIVVSSKDPQLAALFNLPWSPAIVGESSLVSTGRNNQILGYTVDKQGNIDFPILGNIHVADLSRRGVAALIKQKLISENLVKDPVVTVDFKNLAISVLGEVSKPGKFNIERDQISLLEAISMAGDLTIYGKRDGVFVIREKDGERITYKVDLRSTDFFTSPAYYLQQNDVVYVEPNSVRAGQSSVNDNSLKSISLWISIASFLTTVGVLIFK